MRGDKSNKKKGKWVWFDQSIGPYKEESDFISSNHKLLDKMNLESPWKFSKKNLTRLNEFKEETLVKKLQFDEDKLLTSVILSRSKKKEKSPSIKSNISFKPSPPWYQKKSLKKGSPSKTVTSSFDS